MRIKLVLGTALLTAALPLSALAAELRMTVWTSSEAQLATLNEIAASFTEQNPETTVKFETIPWSDYVQKVTLQLAGGNPPDLGWLAEASAPAFVDAGALADISSYLSEDSEYDLADFTEGSLDLWSNGDAIYGVPFSSSAFVTYYNEDMYRAAGLETPGEFAARGEWTWEKLRSDAAALTSSGVYGFQDPGSNAYDTAPYFLLTPLLRAHGAEVWADGECQLNSPEAVAATTIFHDMVFKDRSAVPPGEKAEFFTGNAALTFGQISRATQLDGASFKWNLAPLPQGPAGSVGVLGQAGVVVFAGSRNPEEAGRFLAYMTSKAGTEMMTQFYPPARSSVLSSEAFLNSNTRISPEGMAVVAQAAEGARVLPNSPRYPQIEAAQKPIFDKLWRADADVGAVLDEVCTTISGLI